MATDFEISQKWAGDRKTMLLPCAADTLYPGMPLSYNGTNKNYENDAASPQVIYWDKQQTITSETSCLCAVSGADVLDSALVDNTGAALTVTDDIRNSFLTHGIRMRSE